MVGSRGSESAEVLKSSRQLSVVSFGERLALPFSLQPKVRGSYQEVGTPLGICQSPVTGA